MKILLITDLYPVMPEETGTPKTLLNFVKSWQKFGHEVKIIKPNFLLNSYIRKKPFYKTGWYGNIYNVNYLTPFLGNVHHKLKNFYKANFAPDLIIAHMPSGILFAQKLGQPFVAGIHNSDIEVLTKPLYKIHFANALRKALKQATCIACRSEVLEKKLQKIMPEISDKSFIAPSGIPAEIIVPETLPKNLHSKIKILTCANFKKRKNIKEVILALKDLEGFELTVIGDGNLRKKLETIDKSVTFTGRLPNEDVLKFMRQSDIFILPSVDETFGMVYLEAMASGCITICTQNDGIDGIIKNGENGFTVEPHYKHIRDILETIKKLYAEGNKINEIRENSLQTVNKYIDNDCAMKYLENIAKYNI